MSLMNPFVPFLAEQIADNGLERVAMHDSLGHVTGYMQDFGNSTLISNELGQHMQTLQHLCNGTTLINDALGHSQGQINSGFDHASVLTDNLGHHISTFHDLSNGTAQISDQMGHSIANVHDFGHTLNVTDGLGHAIGSVDI